VKPVEYHSLPAVDGAKIAQVTNTLARWLPSEGDAAPVRDWDRDAWRAAAWIVYWQSALPWLAERVRVTDAPIPQELAKWLLVMEEDCRERTRRMLVAAVEFVQALRDVGVDSIPLKGAAIAPLYYPDPLLRPMGDIDVLVRRKHVARGIAVLQSLGYRFYSCSAEDEVYLRGERKRNVWAPDNVQPLEMHYVLREEYAGLAYDLTEQMWQSSTRRASWGGVEMLVPDTPMLLCHVCAHATSDWLIRRGRLMQIDDVRKLAASMSPGDWDSFCSLVGAEGARFVYPALGFALKYVGDIPVPDEVIAWLRRHSPQNLRLWVDGTELAEASESNPTARDGLGFVVSQLMARSSREKVQMWLRSVFPRRWNLTKRYPRLVSTPFWPLGYVLLNGDRLWHVARARWSRR
jgi:hypothetical protein